jgi:hypothetical protein
MVTVNMVARVAVSMVTVPVVGTGGLWCRMLDGDRLFGAESHAGGLTRVGWCSCWVVSVAVGLVCLALVCLGLVCWAGWLHGYRPSRYNEVESSSA